MVGGSSRGLRGSDGASASWDDAGWGDQLTNGDGSGEAGENKSNNGSEELHCGVVFGVDVRKRSAESISL